MARVITSSIRPKPLSTAVGALFGRRLPSLEKRTLIRGGKPLASTYVKR